MADSDARAAYEAIYTEWLNAARMAALYKTTAERLEEELAKLAHEERKRSGRYFSSIEPDSVFGPKPKP